MREKRKKYVGKNLISVLKQIAQNQLTEFNVYEILKSGYL